METSAPWDGVAVGHATRAPYSADEWIQTWQHKFGSDDNVGVLPGVGNDLWVSGVATPVTVETGAALVKGRWYYNDAALTLAVPSPTPGNERIDYIALECDWTGGGFYGQAQTVRAMRVAGTEGVAPVPPTLTQTDGTLWQIPLAEVRITAAGAITVTNLPQEVLGQAVVYDFVRAIEMDADPASPAAWDNTYSAWRFDAVTDEFVRFTTWAPTSMRDRIQAFLIWAVHNTITPPNDTVRWSASWSVGARPGDDMFLLIGGAYAESVTIDAGFDDLRIDTEIADQNLSPNQPYNGFYRFIIGRDADHGDDDYPNDAWLFGVLMRYT